MIRGERMSRRRSAGPSLVALSFSLAALTVVPSAHAEETESPARALFKQGRALVSEGKYAEACPKFEESLRLEVGVGTQFNLADCWEHIGKPASAQKLFLGAAASAKAAGQTDREQVLRERAAALEPRISKLVIEVLDENPKLSIKRDQLPLEAEQIGKAEAEAGRGYWRASAEGIDPGQAWDTLCAAAGGAGRARYLADRLRPTAQAGAWKAGLPHARVTLVPDTGHLVFEETPSAAHHVTDFLAE